MEEAQPPPYWLRCSTTREAAQVLAEMHHPVSYQKFSNESLGGLYTSNNNPNGSHQVSPQSPYLHAHSLTYVFKIPTRNLFFKYKQDLREAATICPAPYELTFLPFDLESGVCGLPVCQCWSFYRPFFSRLGPHVRDRQTSDSIIA